MKTLTLLALAPVFAICGDPGTSFVVDTPADAGLHVHAKNIIRHADGPACDATDTKGAIDCGWLINVNIWSNVAVDGKVDDAEFTVVTSDNTLWDFACIYQPILDFGGNVVKRNWMCFDSAAWQHGAYLRHEEGGNRLIVWIPRWAANGGVAWEVNFEIPEDAAHPTLGGPSIIGACSAQTVTENGARMGPELEAECGWMAGR